MTSEWIRPEPGAWINVVPRSVIDIEDPHGNPCRTPMDRRWLWHIETVLAVSAPLGSELRQCGQALRQYLNETCDHHWISRHASHDLAAYRQCLRCCVVLWSGEEGDDDA